MAFKEIVSKWFAKYGTAIGAAIMEFIILTAVYFVCNMFFGPAGTTIALAVLLMRLLVFDFKH